MSTLSDENKRAVYSACVTESAELYKVIVAVATTFLGGGLYYVEKFVDRSEEPDYRTLLLSRYHSLSWVFFSYKLRGCFYPVAKVGSQCR